MNYLLSILLSLLGVISYAQSSSNNHLQKMEEVSTNVKNDTVTIAILLYNNISLQDFAGPLEVFSKANNLTKGKYKIFTVGLNSGQIVTENNLLKIKPDYGVDSFPKPDYIILPGASMPVVNVLMKDVKLKHMINNWNADPHIKIVSICTASYILANAGILYGKKATTHYFVADYFEEQYPKIDLIRDVRYVDEGKILTSSGVTSGIDAALYIVGKHHSEMIVDMINRALQYNYKNNEKWPTAKNGMRYNGEGK